MFIENKMNGAITTSLKSVVSHKRKQTLERVDETVCPVKAGRKPNRKMAFSYLHTYPDITLN